MRKLKITFSLLGVLCVIIFAGCLKNENTDAGPQGPAGKAGLPGGNVPGGYNFPATLSSNTVIYGSSPFYYTICPFPTYIDSNSYLVNVFINRPQQKEWYKLPQYNVFATGDEIFESFGHDTIKIWYFSANSGWPNDSTISANVVVIPQQRH